MLTVENLSLYLKKIDPAGIGFASEVPDDEYSYEAKLILVQYKFFKQGVYNKEIFASMVNTMFSESFAPMQVEIPGEDIVQWLIDNDGE